MRCLMFMIIRFIFLLTLSVSFLSISQEMSESTELGLPPSQSTCEIYSKHVDWLPDAFINNAICACLKIPNEPSANIIREVLIERLDSVDVILKNRAIEMKVLFIKKEISKHQYNKFIKKEITSIIHEDHIVAYEKAGCKANPAPYFGWKQITTRKVKSCNLIWFSIRYFGGSCSGKWGRW